MSLSVPQVRRFKGIFDISALHSIIPTCLHLPLGFIYAPLFLLAFFAFLRLSNIVPTSPSSFSPLVHLCRGDVIFHPTFATVVIKWSKTFQSGSQFSTVQVPSLGSPPLCPHSSLKAMFFKFPLPPNAPLFAVPQGQAFTVLTQSKVRKTLSNMLSSIGIDASSPPFHTFRLSGASLAFNSDVSLQAIQHQGTWTSDTVWNYIISNPQQQSSVSTTFQNLLYLQ